MNTLPLVQLLTAASPPVWGVVAREWARALEATGAIVFLFDGPELRVGGAFPSRAVAEKRLRVPAGQGLVGQVASIGHAIHMAADSPRSPDLRMLLGLGETGSVARLCLPARSLDGQTRAVVSLHRKQPFSGEDLSRWQPVADLIGLRLQAEQLRDAVDAHHGERDRLIAQAISAQEAERRRIAFDLHDGVTTALASMSFHLNAAELSLGRGGASAIEQVGVQIGAAKALLDLAYAQTRAAITGLHSLVLDDHGLVAAVETLVETAPDTVIELQADGEAAFEDVSNHAAAALFRIAQESISNAIRHAEAAKVVVTLQRTENAVVLSTTDDGIGFDPRARMPGDHGASQSSSPRSEADHFGLSSIAERCALIGASLQIDSGPGRGTAVIVELPMPQG